MTVVVLALMAVALVLAVAVVALGRVAQARGIAQAAADASALAAAQALQTGADGCAQAPAVADRNGATVTSCEVIGADVLVSTAVPVDPLVLWTMTATASARAGPAP